MFNVKKIVIYCFLLIALFVFVKTNEFSVLKEKENSQDVTELTTKEENLGNKVIFQKNSEILTPLSDTIKSKKKFPLLDNEDIQVQDIDAMPEELIDLETVAKQDKEQGHINLFDIDGSDVTPQELLDLEYSVAEEDKRGDDSVEFESSEIIPQELLDLEYVTQQERTGQSDVIRLESSEVTPKELLDLEIFSRKQNELGLRSSVK